jgi:tetratricopeptide (TPR) repeat protein
MRRSSRWLLCVLALGFPLPALAQVRPASGGSSGGAMTSSSGEPQTKEQIEAQQHFQRAKELYAGGSYREAVAELEAARALDPKAKDLVFNLGIVHEKLQKYDEAIADFRIYLEMDGVTAQERAKAESVIKRIEGAKHEVTPTPTTTATATATTSPTHPPPPDEHGRVDAATIAAGSVAVVGLGVGTTFGILALGSQPKDFVTGRDGTYQDLVDKTNNAHTLAIVSDVGFAVGVVALIATAYLYFGRTKATTTGFLLPGPGSMILGGTFR